MDSPKFDMKTLQKLFDEFENVPFGMSQFQIKTFLESVDNKARCYRQVLLELSKRIEALKAAEFRRDRFRIDLMEIDDKLKSWRTSKYDKMRLQIERDEKVWNLEREVKFIRDCGVEIVAFMSVKEALPQITRQEFEQEEGDYWTNRLISDARRQVEMKDTGIQEGTLKTLDSMGLQPLRIRDGRGNERFEIVDKMVKQRFLEETIKKMNEEQENAKILRIGETDKT